MPGGNWRTFGAVGTELRLLADLTKAHAGAAGGQAVGIVTIPEHHAPLGADVGADAVSEVQVPNTYFRLAAWKRYAAAP